MITEETKQKAAEFFRRTIKESKALAKEVAGDVKKKTENAIGIWDDEHMLDLISFTRKELIKNRSLPNAEILKKYKKKK